MAKLLSNGLRQLRNSLNVFTGKYNEFRFGLSLISAKRYQQYYRWTLVSSSCLTTGLYLSYNTVLIDRYKCIVHSYTSADLTPLNKHLEIFAEKVWSECNQSLRKSPNLVQFFASVGSEPISIGTYGLPTGAVIGLPFLFNYRTVDDVKTIDLRFKGEHNPYTKWRSEAGKAFIASLVLTEKAKKYAIARRIHTATNTNLALDCLNITFATLVAIGLGQEVIKRVKAFKTIGHRNVVRSISVIVAYYLWSNLNKLNNYWASVRADQRTISMGDDYYEGALEYYVKLKTRNAAYYQLTEDIGGWKVFTPEGEVKGLFTAHLFTINRQLNYLKSLKHQSQDVTTDVMANNS